MIKVVFICLGNICRSPMAEGVFQHLVNEAGLGAQFTVDSAGTGGWHVGEAAHPGTQAILRDHEIPYHGRARQVSKQDVADEQTWLMVMDGENLREMRRRFGEHPRLHRLLEFATNHPGVDDVPDPYYTGGFDYVYALVEDGAQGLLAHIRTTAGI